jgi:hypothetical protein
VSCMEGEVHPGYRRRWNAKVGWYEKQGVRRPEDGGGERATLVVTEDSPEGGIDSQRIQGPFLRSGAEPTCGRRLSWSRGLSRDPALHRIAALDVIRGVSRAFSNSIT